MFRKLGGIVLITSLLIGCDNFDTNKTNLSAFTELDSLSFQKELIQLGEDLFFDSRLSIDNSISCASCHLPELAFSDGKKVSKGVHQRKGKRNTPTLWNIDNQPHFMWDGGIKSLEMQALVPLQDTNEMGGELTSLFPKLANIKEYEHFAQKLYNRNFDPYVLTRALAAYQRSIYRENSEYDQWKREGVIEDSALLRGYAIFNEKLNCSSCHSTSTFTNDEMINNGLYTVYEDKGRYNITGDSSDIGKFKTPTLRNIGITSPYMHDGSISNLHLVIQHYAKGGENHRNKSKELTPFEIRDDEIEDLIYFLNSLTDEGYLN